MSFQISDVIWISIFIIGAAVWWNGQGVKAFALQKVKKYCEHADLQLLDETLVARKIWLVSDASRLLAIRRTFAFEFTSTGEHRYQGTAVLVGYRVQLIEVDPHHLS